MREKKKITYKQQQVQKSLCLFYSSPSFCSLHFFFSIWFTLTKNTPSAIGDHFLHCKEAKMQILYYTGKDVKGAQKKSVWGR